MNVTAQDIYERLGIENADETTKKKVLQNIVELTEERFAEVAQQLLTEGQFAQLDSMSDSDEFEKLGGWLRANVPKASEIYESVLLDAVNEVREKLGSFEQ